MQHTINSFRRDCFKQVYQVYEVFQNFFGEARVDLQGLPNDDEIAEDFEAKHIPMREDGSCYEADSRRFKAVARDFNTVLPFILIYWPQVRVTNENDRFVDIQDLYAKIELTSEGYIPTENTGFLLNRATYPIDQWKCGYLHSHVSGIPKGDLQAFQRPCLGSGPIINTITNLKKNICEGFDETRWMLFCHELSLYVTVESLRGVPYKYLENINDSIVYSSYGGFNSSYTAEYAGSHRLTSCIKDFISYYLQHGHLSFNYQGEEFKVGMSYFDFIIDISNTFIEYYNNNYPDDVIAKKCFSYGILKSVIVSDGKFYRDGSSPLENDYDRYEGRKVCTFKGQDVTLHIFENTSTPSQKTIVLSHGIAMYILDNILKIINYHYTNEYRRNQANNISTAALPATTGQRVYYI